jgi:hypothetical protein
LTGNDYVPHVSRVGIACLKGERLGEIGIEGIDEPLARPHIVIRLSHRARCGGGPPLVVPPRGTLRVALTLREGGGV